MSMGLYDDFDNVNNEGNEVAGWSSGMKLFQSQLQLRKVSSAQTKRDPLRVRGSKTQLSVLGFTSKKDQEYSTQNVESVNTSSSDLDWISNEIEYNCFSPNNYELVIKELRQLREDEEDRIEETKKMNAMSHFEPSVIDEPPQIQTQIKEKDSNSQSVAARIMVKYGFKEGLGLGKDKQGIVTALQVEKTSIRGGRIIHPQSSSTLNVTPLEPPPPPPQEQEQEQEHEPSITEIIKTPSKVILLRNLVGAGEVDIDLEPEVRLECNTKYGEVIRVVIHEMTDSSHPSDAIRIFVEFTRIESAIKAVVDLNGRFFGGRQVKAGFYSVDKFESNNLTD